LGGGFNLREIMTYEPSDDGSYDHAMAMVFLISMGS
jgi:hypothetical protein